jgi:hypothetical protein
MATSAPAGSTSGRHHRASRSRGATARAGLVEEPRPAQQRLDQGHPQVRSGDGQHDAGQAGAGTDVGHARGLRHQLAQHRAVEEVPLPQPGSLAWAEEAADHAVGRQQLGVPLGERQAVHSEHPPRLDGHGGCFT